jgi:hypothetical protein
MGGGAAIVPGGGGGCKSFPPRPASSLLRLFNGHIYESDGGLEMTAVFNAFFRFFSLLSVSLFNFQLYSKDNDLFGEEKGPECHLSMLYVVHERVIDTKSEK